MTRTLIWIVEDTWEATVDAARAVVGPDADVTVLHVAVSYTHLTLPTN